MIKFEKLKVGMTIYDVHRYKMGNTTMTAQGVWAAKVLGLDASKQSALISWNGNRPGWHSAHSGYLRGYRMWPPEWCERDPLYRRLPYYCYMCSAEATREGRDSSLHALACEHPKAIAWRKKRAHG